MSLKNINSFGLPEKKYKNIIYKFSPSFQVFSVSFLHLTRFLLISTSKIYHLLNLIFVSQNVKRLEDSNNSFYFAIEIMSASRHSEFAASKG